MRGLSAGFSQLKNLAAAATARVARPHVLVHHAPKADMLAFNLRQGPLRLGARIGDLVVRGRPAIATPMFVACTSRGAVPHVTPDIVERHTSISVAYAGLEDFLEKSQQSAPILKAPEDVAVGGSILRAYTGLPDRCLSILGARRVPRLSTPHQNTNNALAISTSFGFAALDIVDYNTAIQTLKPDISTTAVDLVQTDKISRKRIEKSADRTHAWLRDTLNEVDRTDMDVPLFASIPPLEPEQQSFYLSDLADDFKHELCGICVYDAMTASAIPDELGKLPILCLSDPAGPHDVLAAISLGIDLITTPFVSSTSEAGIAFSFTFVPPAESKDRTLGVDMWDTSHATDLGPLSPDCTCYSCSRHHRAYVHHLLQAKEMLAWTLLQIHNFHILNCFFNDIRASISQDTFEADNRTFRLAYASGMPHTTGQGPRIRGYQARSVGQGEPPKNAKAYNKLEEQARKVDEATSGIATPASDMDVDTLESQGLGRKLG